jgi:competence protein ComEC
VTRRTALVLVLVAATLAGCSMLAQTDEEATPTESARLSETDPVPALATATTAGTTTATATSTPTATATTVTAAPTTTPTATATSTATPPATPPTATRTTGAATAATATPSTGTTGAGRPAIVSIDAEGESIVLENAGGEPLDLAGYVADFGGFGQRYEFPDYSLGPGETVTLHTGWGDSAGTTLYADFLYPVIDDGGDRVVIETPDGEIADARNYRPSGSR